MNSRHRMPTKKIGRWIVLAVVGALVASMFFGKAGVSRIYRSLADVKKKERLLSRERAELDSLTAQNSRLKSDTAYMEKIGREKLGMARKDEKVYRFIPEQR